MSKDNVISLENPDVLTGLLRFDLSEDHKATVLEKMNKKIFG